MTMLEVLVAVSIVAAVATILLPAVQHARESARMTQCRSQLKQIALGIKAHETTHRFYPSGGWGPTWVGATSEGTGPDQPGGWPFATLAFLEQDIRARAFDPIQPGNCATEMSKLVSTPLPTFVCPTRRSAESLPDLRGGIYQTDCGTNLVLASAARSDYAANGGSRGHFVYVEDAEHAGIDPNLIATTQDPVGNGNGNGNGGNGNGNGGNGGNGNGGNGNGNGGNGNGQGNGQKVTICHVTPGNGNSITQVVAPSAVYAHHANHGGDYLGPCVPTVTDVDDLLDQPPTVGNGKSRAKNSKRNPQYSGNFGITTSQNGMVSYMSRVREVDVVDGTSHTFLVGEKSVDPNHYATGRDEGDESNLFVGFSNETVRWTHPGYGAPRQDAYGLSQPHSFGSAHRGGWNVAFGDGSVQTMSFAMPAELVSQLGGTDDGVPH